LPSSEQRNARREEGALEPLTKRGWGTAQRETRGKGASLRYAQEAVSSGYEAVIIAGGDGTVNEVVNGLMGVDGDYLGTTPLERTILPRALRVIIPEIETDFFQRGAKG